MIKVIHWLVVIGLLLPLHPPILQAQTATPAPVEAYLAEMSAAQKVGQLFMVSYFGTDVGSESEIGTLIRDYHIGGVVLQSSNENFSNTPNAPGEIAAISNQLQQQALNNQDLPLFIAIDHEGDGWPYTRITTGVTQIPSQMSVGATWQSDHAYAVGKVVGQELAAMGINVILGPVLDVLNEPRPAGRGDMGTRTFGGDPFWVGQFGQAYIRGIHDGSNQIMLTVAKHFPGRGGSDRLPDNEVATVDKSLQALKRIELAPFFAVTDQTAAETGGMTDAMMSSHIRYRGFQGDIRQFTAPISFDAAGMSTLLSLPEFVPWRSSGGLIISDALGVPAVRKHFDPTLQTFPHRRIAREAFLAGNDILLLSQFDLNSIWAAQYENTADTLRYFQTLYDSDPIFAQRVDDAVRRILQQKLKRWPTTVSYPDLAVDPEVALAIGGQGTQAVQRIAAQSLTLLYPSPQDYTSRVPRVPAINEQILIVTDSRLVRECFSDYCEPFEALPTDALAEIIVAMYGPTATKQVLPENINSINYAELKQVLVGSLAQNEPDPDEPQVAVLRYSAAQVAAMIQAADWIIFVALDENPTRYPTSDALSLFLAQGLSALYNKTLIVFAMNAPYFLDTTEISKLTAYFGLYSKTEPHLEMAAKTLFGEAAPAGASPVSIDGLAYNLADVLAPDPLQDIPLQVETIEPESRQAPVTVTLSAGPILDHNGRPVPDGTPVQFVATYANGIQVDVPLTGTIAGLATQAVWLTEAGSIAFKVFSGEASSAQSQFVNVTAPPTPTPTDSPTSTPTVAPTLTPRPSATPTVTPQIVVPSATFTAPPVEIIAPTTPSSSPGPRAVNPVDFVITLLAIGVALLAGLWLWQAETLSFSRRIRFGLVGFSAGMLAYLLYGIGWLRPELFFEVEPSMLIQRLALGGLVLLFAMAGHAIEQQSPW